MIKQLKGEVYKLINGPFVLYSLLIIFIYALFAHYIYLNDYISLDLLYENYLAEYIILFLTLIIFYSSVNFSDEYVYGTIDDLKNKNVIFAKIILQNLYLIICFVFAFLVTYDISGIIKTGYTIEFNTLVNIFESFFKAYPMLLILSLFCNLLSIITKKANIALGCTFLFYLFSDYINNYLLSKNLNILLYFPTLNWNYNALYQDSYLIASVSIIGTISLLLCLIIITYKRR